MLAEPERGLGFPRAGAALPASARARGPGKPAAQGREQRLDTPPVRGGTNPKLDQLVVPQGGQKQRRLPPNVTGRRRNPESALTLASERGHSPAAPPGQSRLLGLPALQALPGCRGQKRESHFRLCEVTQVSAETFLLQRKARLHPSQRAGTAPLLGGGKRQLRGVAHRAGDSWFRSRRRTHIPRELGASFPRQRLPPGQKPGEGPRRMPGTAGGGLLPISHLRTNTGQRLRALGPAAVPQRDSLGTGLLPYRVGGPRRRLREQAGEMGAEEGLGRGGQRRDRNGRRDPPASEGSKWASIVLEAQLKWRPASCPSFVHTSSPGALPPRPSPQAAESPPEQTLGRGREVPHEAERHPTLLESRPENRKSRSPPISLNFENSASLPAGHPPNIDTLEAAKSFWFLVELKRERKRTQTVAGLDPGLLPPFPGCCESSGPAKSRQGAADPRTAPPPPLAWASWAAGRAVWVIRLCYPNPDPLGELRPGPLVRRWWVGAWVGRGGPHQARQPPPRGPSSRARLCACQRRIQGAETSPPRLCLRSAAHRGFRKEKEQKKGRGRGCAGRRPGGEAVPRAAAPLGPGCAAASARGAARTLRRARAPSSSSQRPRGQVGRGAATRCSASGPGNGAGAGDGSGAGRGSGHAGPSWRERRRGAAGTRPRGEPRSGAQLRGRGAPPQHSGLLSTLAFAAPLRAVRPPRALGARRRWRAPPQSRARGPSAGSRAGTHRRGKQVYSYSNKRTNCAGRGGGASNRRARGLGAALHKAIFCVGASGAFACCGVIRHSPGSSPLPLLLALAGPLPLLRRRSFHAGAQTFCLQREPVSGGGGRGTRGAGRAAAPRRRHAAELQEQRAHRSGRPGPAARCPGRGRGRRGCAVHRPGRPQNPAAALSSRGPAGAVSGRRGSTRSRPPRARARLCAALGSAPARPGTGAPRARPPPARAEPARGGRRRGREQERASREAAAGRRLRPQEPGRAEDCQLPRAPGSPPYSSAELATWELSAPRLPDTRPRPAKAGSPWALQSQRSVEPPKRFGRLTRTWVGLRRGGSGKCNAQRGARRPSELAEQR
ncbi:collagen, type I, alpha 1b-like [Equus asinus]|uniref:collagen, type I, alpha 1b-like n=1 Tax=Equus asinus TaxID=9793 RepID=UPI0038F5D318